MRFSSVGRYDNMDNLYIREFKSDDLETVIDLHRKAMENAGAYKGDGPWDDDLRNIENHYHGGVFLIGEIDGVIVSMGAYRKISDTTAEVKRMRTSPEHQGNGFGRKVLHELIYRAQQAGYTELILETSEKQTAAIRLYTDSGFMKFKDELIDGFNCGWYRLDLRH
jgi:ribosomal protein S18 acetylase RimI-like enzyme